MTELIEKLEAALDRYGYYCEEAGLRTAIAIARQHQADALQHATDILANFKPEGQRTKYEELEACYAMLFKQLVAVTEQKHVQSLNSIAEHDQKPADIEHVRCEICDNDGYNFIHECIMRPKEVISHVSMLWHEYALCPNELLTEGAIELKSELLSAFRVPRAGVAYSMRRCDR